MDVRKQRSSIIDIRELRDTFLLLKRSVSDYDFQQNTILRDVCTYAGNIRFNEIRISGQHVKYVRRTRIESPRLCIIHRMYYLTVFSVRVCYTKYLGTARIRLYCYVLYIIWCNLLDRLRLDRSVYFKNRKNELVSYYLVIRQS